jgi:hypothetical protein
MEAFTGKTVERMSCINFFNVCSSFSVGRMISIFVSLAKIVLSYCSDLISPVNQV